MRPVRRKAVRKMKSVKQFRRNAGRTHPKNVKMVDRGGYRL